ncbi:MAG: sensor histidine kinase [Methylophilus sp.]|nr:sensor histidine kinase [Methylophilus sp.]
MKVFTKLWQALSPVKRDVIFLTFCVSLLYGFVLYINLAELISDSLAKYEEFQLDELPYLILFIALSMALFTKNRMAELRETIALKELAEKDNAVLLAENKLLTQHVLEVQERERLELARELHDDIGQFLTGISLDIATLVSYQDENIALLAKRISNNCRMTRNISRKLIRRLRPSTLDSQGIVAAVKAVVQEWMTYNPKIKAEIEIDDAIQSLSEKTNITIYRVVQEALTNISKHAHASQINIVLKFDQAKAAISLLIRDNGIGIQKSTKKFGFGLIGMRERIHALQGEINIHSVIAQGTTLQVLIPTQHFKHHEGTLTP